MLWWTTIRLSGAAVLVLGALSVPAAAGLLSDVAALPNPFSPNGDGVYDEIEISYVLAESTWVEVDIEDSLGSVVRNLNAGDWEQEAGAHGYTWDGRDDGSAMQPDGSYYLVIEANYVREVELLVILDTEAPGIGDLAAVPSRFTPDGDGVADSTRISFLGDSGDPTDQFWVVVLDTLGDPLKELLSSSNVESVHVYWNGRDDSGAAAQDTLYTLRVSTLDAAGNAAEQAMLIDLDTDPPSHGVHYLPDPEVEEVRVAASRDTTVSGWAYDRAGVTAVEFSVDGGESWANLTASLRDPGDRIFRWTHVFACEACTLGVVDETIPVLIRGHDGTLTADGEGHVNTDETTIPVLSFDIVFDVAAPAHDTTYVQGGGATYTSGQEIVVTTLWDAGGYDMEGDFSLVDSEFDTSGVVVSDAGTGLYTVSYTTSAENTFVPVYDAEVRITATDCFGRSIADSSLTVTVVPGSGGPTGLSLDRNSFNPISETLTVGFGSGVGDITIEIYNMAGVLVRTIESEECSSIRWYGKNDNGDWVASGVYFLRIRTTGAGHATRKVAVIR